MASTSTESKCEDCVKPAPLDVDPPVQAKSELPDHNSEAHTVDAGKGSTATSAAASTGETGNATEPVWQSPCDENPSNRLLAAAAAGNVVGEPPPTSYICS
ncbi:hypothetical protein HS088_TW09G01165 [Tripterygium wilfordii]|uniref:Uncharacterized protein n=1 Tax=Tripterygium wilfordii TaxID=458696 RepID=A0A7J7D9Q7_TRIWF|nr:hypothetical protein HS088_TW09G01165 [Tripterygium wilfordii]